MAEKFMVEVSARHVHLNKEAVKKIADRGCQLMITVDCRNFCNWGNWICN